MQKIKERTELIRLLHDSQKQVVIATTGGGSMAICDILAQPGATRTMLEAHIPYSRESLIRFLGQEPKQACCADTARQLAMTCFTQGQDSNEKKDLFKNNPDLEQLEESFWNRRISDKGGTNFFGSAESEKLFTSYKNKTWCKNLVGIGCTASLASDRPKRGEHRFHIAVQTYNRTSTLSLTLKKGTRTRQEEERLVADFILKVLAETSELDVEFEVPILEDECVQTEQYTPDDAIIELLMGDAAAVLCVKEKPILVRKIRDVGKPLITEEHPFSPETEYMSCIFAGSFAPIHNGHIRMIEIGEERLQTHVALEIAVRNVDKAPLDYIEIGKRLSQIESVRPGQAVWLTRTVRFIDKSQLFREATFLVGADTLNRIGDQKYYGNNHSVLMDVMRRITYYGCRFLVFARRSANSNGKIDDLRSLTIPDMLRTLCEEVPREEFCEDISSTEIRKLTTQS